MKPCMIRCILRIQGIVIQSRPHILIRQMRNQIKHRQSEIGLTHGILTIHDHFSNQTVRNAFRMELVIMDIREING